MGLVGPLCLSLAACASQMGPGGTEDVRLTTYPPAGAAHRVASPAIELFWSCSRPGPNTLQVEGWAINRWFTGEVQDVRLELVGVGAGGKTISAASRSTIADRIGTMRAVPFVVTLSAQGSERRFDLYYEYRFQEPGDDTFYTSRGPLPFGGRILRIAAQPDRLAQVPSRFMVWNVCDESLHRVK
jgi:hypothetical protein